MEGFKKKGSNFRTTFKSKANYSVQVGKECWCVFCLISWKQQPPRLGEQTNNLETELQIFRTFLNSLARLSGVPIKKHVWNDLLGKSGLVKGVGTGTGDIVRICASCKKEMEIIVDTVKELEILRMKGACQIGRFCEELNNQDVMENRKNNLDQRLGKVVKLKVDACHEVIKKAGKFYV